MAKIVMRHFFVSRMGITFFYLQHKKAQFSLLPGAAHNALIF